MSSGDRVAVGDCIAVAISRYDSSGERLSFDRIHGTLQRHDEEGYHLLLNGRFAGEEISVPPDAEPRKMPGGHFFFEESDEWVAPAFAFFMEIRSTS